MKLNKSRGFTLIELLVSIAIIITSATVVVAIITATFRDSNKANTQEQVRIAGDSALAQLSTIVQYANSFEGSQALNDDGAVTSTSQTCSSDPDNASVDAVKVLSDGTTHTIACTNSSLLLDGQSLFDSNRFTINDCNLTCLQSSSVESPLISVQFDLSVGDGSLAESSTQISSFSKTMRVKNLSQ